MRLISAILVMMLFAACQHPQSPQDPARENANEVSGANETINPIAKKALIWQKATVVFIPHSGGFYGLVTEKGEKLLPLNLPDNFRIDGIVINVFGHKAPNVITSVNWGSPFDVKQVNLLINKN
ncbi:hypothetical protein [Rheinheimera baltica]|uniref:hypothetical protein n=1 Tax=Rheinheimera baltica TaxID=67576 RepID=UPI000402490A|nr:hypothetical protein [Rheinheimera baltica]MDP5150425.1 hypothetical protein [Rheinheimera baltica]